MTPSRQTNAVNSAARQNRQIKKKTMPQVFNFESVFDNDSENQDEQIWINLLLATSRRINTYKLKIKVQLI